MSNLFNFLNGILKDGTKNSKGRLLYSVIRALKILCACVLIILVLVNVKLEHNLIFFSGIVLPDNISNIFGDNIIVILSVTVSLVLANILSVRTYGIVTKKTSDDEKRATWCARSLMIIDIVYSLLTIWYVGYTFNILLLFSRSGNITITFIQRNVGYFSLGLLMVYIIRCFYYSNLRFVRDQDFIKTPYSDVVGKRITSKSIVFYYGEEHSVVYKDDRWRLYPKGCRMFTDDKIVDLEQAASNPDGNIRVET